jgi:uncharacterized membrane protein YccC
MRDIGRGQFRANSRSLHFYSITSSARLRDSQTERPGGLEINNEFDFSRLLNRQLGWFVAFKNTASIKADDEFVQKRPASFNATRTGVTFLVGTLTASAASAFFVWSSL